MQTKRGYEFVQVDVFTDRMFGGNPLAVFPHAEGLTDDEMLAIAKEMNLSETTFVLPPTQPDCAARVRIFTPGRELPFAGLEGGWKDSKLLANISQNDLLRPIGYP